MESNLIQLIMLVNFLLLQQKAQGNEFKEKVYFRTYSPQSGGLAASGPVVAFWQTVQDRAIC